jgi:hypothetical protein
MVVRLTRAKAIAQPQLRPSGAKPPQFWREELKPMKNHAPFAQDNAPISDLVLETVVSAHYLVLQMRMLISLEQFAGQAETKLMADALSRWAQVAATRWRDGDSEPLAAPPGRAPPFEGARHRTASTP